MGEKTKEEKETNRGKCQHCVGSKGKLKKRCITVITCSVCEGTCHNMRYHRKADSALEAWFESAINPVNENSSNRVVNDYSKVKLVPRRPPSNIASEVQLSTPKSNFQSCPTLGIGITSVSQFNNYGPLLNQRGSSTMGKAPPQMQTTSIPLESLVEDLQDIENQEKARKMVAMIEK